MTVLVHRLLNGRPWLLAVPQTTVPSPGPLTDIIFTQFGSIAEPDMSESMRPDTAQLIIGELRAVGGVGPYTFGFGTNNAAGYRLNTGTKRGMLVIPYDAIASGGTDTLDVIVTDALGRALTKSITVDKTALGPLIYLSPASIPANQTSTFYGFGVGVAAYGTGHSGNDTFAVTSDPSGLWSFQYGRLAPSQVPAVGSYPIGLSATGTSGTITATRIITITSGVIAGPIYFTPGLVSTSMVLGATVGTAYCSTPNNAGGWAITDATGTLQIDQNGVVTVKNTPAAGPLGITLARTENGATYIQSFSLFVRPGTTLPATNMTLTPNVGLLNIGQNEAVGTPSISGITGTKQWSLVQENWNTYCVTTGSVGYLFAIDPSTGAITAPGLLMAKTHKLVVTCTDGINTCTQTFNVPVAWAPTVRTVHVGRGMAALHGPDGFETFAEARGQSYIPRAGTLQVNVYADADDNYYANDNGNRTTDYNLRYPWQGPVIVSGIAANGKQQPRIGGDISKWSQTGNDMRGKGFFVAGNGDCILENFEVSHCFGADQTHGIEGIRKDGETYGNLTVRKCYIHDCDNGIETGLGGSDIILQDNEIVGCGTSHISGGACHNVYIGNQWSVLIERNFSAMAMTGHDFKCRATRGTIQNNRLFDLERGGASCNIDLPDGGDYVIQNNTLHKGTMAQNPFSIQYAAEFDNPDAIETVPEYQRHNCLIQNNTFFIATMDGAHWGTPCAIRHNNSTGATGQPSTMQVTGNAFWLAPHAGKINTQIVNDPNTVETGSTILTTPPVLDYRRPWLTGSMPRFGWYRTVTQWGGDTYTNYDGKQIDPGFDDLRIPANTASGTVLATMRANVTLDDWSGIEGVWTSPTNPFAAGTTWVLSAAGVYYWYTLPNRWAPPAAFSLNTRGDGSATLAAGTGLSPGVYYIQPEATAPDGVTKVRNRFYVTVV